MTLDNIARQVAAFYEAHPYPPPVDDLEAYGRSWDDARRRADAHLFYPAEPYRDDRTVLVAGCGTSQAAHYAVRWPHARVVGIDVSDGSLDFAEGLKRKHGLANLELRNLPIERAAELGESFDHIVCTGVLHHLPDPDLGLRALREVLAPEGALHLMVYAPYGRAGVYMLQDYCRRLGVRATAPEIDALLASLKALPTDHPLAGLLRHAPDFADRAGVADALLNPQDRAYSVPQLFELLKSADLTFGRWVRQAPYLPWCGGLAAMPHHARLAALPPQDHYAAIELFRGTMVRHAMIAWRNGVAVPVVDFDGDEWPRYRPIRLPETRVIRERLPHGAAAVAVNRNHTFTDLYLPIDAAQLRWLEAVDGNQTVAQIAGESDAARAFFEQLWRWDQIVINASLS